MNLRSGLQGIFPSAYVVDVEYNDFDPSANKVKMERYVVNYLGSIETLYHKGNEVLCQAVKKIASQDNYVATHARACILEISDQGIHMVDKGKLVVSFTRSLLTRNSRMTPISLAAESCSMSRLLLRDRKSVV